MSASPPLWAALWIAAALAAAAFALATGRRAEGSSALALAALSGGLWAAFGPGAAGGVAIATGLVGVAALAALLFRRGLRAVLRPESARVAGEMPLTAAFGLLTILIYLAVAAFAPWLAPYGEAEIVGGAYAPPDARMLLGGDQLGRDMLSRLIWGARNTIGIALATTFLAFGVGTLLGLLSATLGGWADQAMGRVVDLLMSIPQLVFALLLLTILGPNVANMILVIALLYAPIVFRLARAVAGGIVVTDYVEAARLRGESAWYLITREVLPNAAAPLAAEFGLRFSFVFLAIAGLSFLGLGIQPPTADWGSMVRDSATLISFGEMTPLIPAGAIALLTVAVNFVVDWMLQRGSGLQP